MKRRFTVVALSAVLLLGLGSGSASFALEKDAKAKDAPKAKDTSKTDSTHDQMMAEMQKYATPGPMHDLLKPMVGTWKAVTKAWMSPGDPTVNAGTCEVSVPMMPTRIEREASATLSGRMNAAMSSTTTRLT